MVGRPGIGKTSCIQTLMKTISAADGGGTVYRESRINPKSMSVDQLFGIFSTSTSDWTDGVFSVLLRRATRVTRGLSLAPFHQSFPHTVFQLFFVFMPAPPTIRGESIMISVSSVLPLSVCPSVNAYFA